MAFCQPYLSHVEDDSLIEARHAILNPCSYEFEKTFTPLHPLRDEWYERMQEGRNHVRRQKRETRIECVEIFLEIIFLCADHEGLPEESGGCSYEKWKIRHRSNERADAAHTITQRINHPMHTPHLT